jgi:hypothetical protein
MASKTICCGYISNPVKHKIEEGREIKKQPPLPRRMPCLARSIAGFLTPGTLPFAFPTEFSISGILKDTHPVTVAGPLRILTGFPIKNISL